MAATAQDASAPLRGPEKKDEDRDEEGRAAPRSKILHEHRPRSARLPLVGSCRLVSHAYLGGPNPLPHPPSQFIAHHGDPWLMMLPIGRTMPCVSQSCYPAFQPPQQRRQCPVLRGA